MKHKSLLADLPTEFRGISFDDGWEFDMPTIIYFPILKYMIGNGGEFEHGVEDYCIDLQLFLNKSKGCRKPNSDLSDFECREFVHRGWSIPGLLRRKDTTHYLVRVTWMIDSRGQLQFEYGDVIERYGKKPK